MTTATVSVADVLFGQATPTEPSLRNKIIAFITLQRVAVNILTLPVVVGVWALAGGQFNDPKFLLILIGAWFLLAATHVINDLVDTERDKWKWPLRPLPSGLISKSMATFYVIVVTGVLILLGGLVFNWLLAALALLVVVSGYVYVRYTRDTIGHLTVMLPEAIALVAVWSAISPATILTPLPWLAVALAVAGGAAANFINESFDPEIKALFARPRPSTEMVLYVVSILAVFVLSTAIFFYAKLFWPYMLVLVALTVWALTLVTSLREQRSSEMAKKAFMSWGMILTINWLSLAVFYWIK
jgi:4-hydroxybenzoate polyprenyltransferase